MRSATRLLVLVAAANDNHGCGAQLEELSLTVRSPWLSIGLMHGRPLLAQDADVERCSRPGSPRICPGSPCTGRGYFYSMESGCAASTVSLIPALRFWP